MHPGRVALTIIQLGFFDGAKMIEPDEERLMTGKSDISWQSPPAASRLHFAE